MTDRLLRWAAVVFRFNASTLTHEESFMLRRLAPSALVLALALVQTLPVNAQSPLQEALDGAGSQRVAIRRQAVPLSFDAQWLNRPAAQLLPAGRLRILLFDPFRRVAQERRRPLG